MNTPEIIINGLWIGEKLSPIGQLTIRSFQRQGYTFRLWAYDDVQRVPEGTLLADAGKIIPAGEVFSYKNVSTIGVGKGSFAGFSDLFRYKLLLEEGGVWSDMDITCLHEMIELKGEYFFRDHHKIQAVGNLMKAPKGSELMQYCYERTRSMVTADNRDWMLPIKILNSGISKFQLKRFIDKISNDDKFPEVAGLLKGTASIPRQWKLVHWMNEEFRRLQLPDNAFLPSSEIARLLDQHQIGYHVLEGSDELEYRRKLSRLRYVWLSLMGRVLR